MMTHNDLETQYDPKRWRGDARTMPAAHQELIDNWDRYGSGGVLDVEFVLGETTVPKKSERLL